ncbi:MAG: hypothetical protein AAFV25_08215, partial [Bacteroidota bacterium]
MLFRKQKREQRLQQQMDERPKSPDYWKQVWRQYRKNRVAIWALRILSFLAVIALFADFLANDKPIYCQL